MQQFLCLRDVPCISGDFCWVKAGFFPLHYPPVTTKLTLCVSQTTHLRSFQNHRRRAIVRGLACCTTRPRPVGLWYSSLVSPQRSPSRERWFPTGWRSWKGKFLALAAEISHLCSRVDCVTRILRSRKSGRKSYPRLSFFTSRLKCPGRLHHLSHCLTPSQVMLSFFVICRAVCIPGCWAEIRPTSLSSLCQKPETLRSGY